MSKILEVNNLYARANEKQILNGLNLSINKGEVHVIMGPNGAGKSTLANVIFNNPAYKKESGSIFLEDQDITNLRTDEIARLGVFMSFQNPEEISGISTLNFIKTAKNKIKKETIFLPSLKKEIEQNMSELSMKSELLTRDLNVGYSGGEKKKNEILQMLELSPKLAILDETDSGLDVDAIKIVSKGISMFKNENNAVLIITHSTKILEELDVNFVHILVDGKIVYTGDASLASQIEQNGYSKFKVGE
ncbi:MAG: Fe-S cluster assembly ATPase SufC [Clostridia bacterium]|nr:Fe-S cluster assembly ATPase SufC [Clostridia bacterium]